MPLQKAKFSVPTLPLDVKQPTINQSYADQLKAFAKIAPFQTIYSPREYCDSDCNKMSYRLFFLKSHCDVSFIGSNTRYEFLFTPNSSWLTAWYHRLSSSSRAFLTTRTIFNDQNYIAFIFFFEFNLVVRYYRFWTRCQKQGLHLQSLYVVFSLVIVCVLRIVFKI